MSNKIKAILWTASLVLLIGASYIIYNNMDVSSEIRDIDYGQSQESEENKSNASNRMMAPDFTLTDFEGNETSLSDYRGKIVILNFWASWCPPCIAEMPDFDDANKELLQGDDAVILTVNLTNGFRGETEKTAKDFIDRNNFTLPVLLDKEGVAAQKYSVRSIPTTYIIDREGKIITYHIGQIDKKTIIDTVENYK
ncbi:UNVERIFIED_CONTAM: peroxiredoxin [Acetivibrio alkalicellulosi]